MSCTTEACRRRKWAPCEEHWAVLTDWRYDYEEVIFPDFEAPDHYERWDAFTIVAGLYEEMEQRKANGDPPLTPADVCGQMNAYLVSQYQDVLPDFQLVYLKGALLREIAWQDDIKHYQEDPSIHAQLPDWHPLLTLVEQTLQGEQTRIE